MSYRFRAIVALLAVCITGVAHAHEDACPQNTDEVLASAQNYSGGKIVLTPVLEGDTIDTIAERNNCPVSHLVYLARVASPPIDHENLVPGHYQPICYNHPVRTKIHNPCHITWIDAGVNR